MLFTCKKLMFSDSAWKKIFCSTKWLEGGSGAPHTPCPPLSLRPWYVERYLKIHCERNFYVTKFVKRQRQQSELRLKDNFLHFDFHILLGFIVHDASKTICNIMTKNLTSIYWLFLLSGFDFTWYSPLTGQQVNWEAASDSFSFTSQTLTHKPDDYYREITNVHS